MTATGAGARSYWTRRLGRHAVLAAVSAGVFACIYAFIPTDFTMRRLSLASAFASVGFVGCTLVWGPAWQFVRGRRSPVNMEIRRDVGIWGGLVGLLHVVFGLQVHMAGDPVRYFVYPPGEGRVFRLRLDPFGWANLTGLGSALILLALLSISNDVALRSLGSPRWKRLQRMNYAAFALIGIHGVVYQVLERRPLPVMAVFVLGLVAVTALQVAGYLGRRTMGERR